MNKGLKQFIKTSGVFFVGSVLSKVIVFFLLPLYTNYISTENYGYYDLSVTYVTVLSSLVFFDIWATVLRFLYDAKTKEDKTQVLNICWRFFAVSTVVYLIVGTVACLTLRVRYSAFILAYGLSVNIHNLCGFIARGQKHNLDFAVSGIINTFSMMISNLVMILCLHMELSALYISAIAGNLLQAGYLVCRAQILPHFKGNKIDRTLQRKIVSYTLPLCINSVAYWLLTGYNRIIIGQVMGLSANGIYAIGNKFGSAISLLTTCFTYAWQDLAFSAQSSNRANGEFYGKACGYYFMFLGVGIAGMLPCFRIAFPILIGENYAEAYQTIPLFLVMAILSALSTFVGNVFYAIKDTKAQFISMVISCGINLLLCKSLIERFGINGANLSICISFIANILIRYFMLKKCIGIKHTIWHYSVTILIIVAAIMIYSTGNLGANILLLMLIALSVCVLLYLYMKKTKQMKRAGQ